MRFEQSLSGTWQFQLDPEGSLGVENLVPDREIPVPMPWQAAFPELQQYSGYAWYRRTVEIDPAWLRGELLLHFGAVDYWCQVFVNGQEAGKHEGGYTPFTLPIAALARSGKNEITVRVYDAAQTHLNVPRWPQYSANETPAGPPFDPNHIPHGKQEWYINAGGIWQDVTLTVVPSLYLTNVNVTTDIHTGEVVAKVELGGNAVRNDGTILSLSVVDRAEEGQSGTSSMHLDSGCLRAELRTTIEGHKLWSHLDPQLYTAIVSLENGAGKDEIKVRFGFRQVSTRDGRILLNDEPIFLLAALDQDLYADTIYTVPSEEYLRDQFSKAKELGFNCLRCHIKPPDPLYLDLADEMGLLVWAEIPSWRTFYTKGTTHANQLNLDYTTKARVEQTLEEMVRRDFNHASLIIWTIVNEDWGTALPLSASDREWLGRMYGMCKQLDPTRLVVDNSPCPHQWGPSVHVKSDLDDFHIYANIPDQARNFSQAIEQFGLRPAWTYSNHGDAQRTGKEPLVLSEFGNWGLPSLKVLREEGGADPSWFDIGPWWSPWEGGPGWPRGSNERFERLGLDKVWDDYESFAIATQWHQYAAMKFEIETLRRQPEMAGYVITELTDAYWESNGLLDFYRNPKAYHDIFAQINAPNVIVAQVERYSYWDDQQVFAKVFLSHFGPEEWHETRLRWSIDGTQLRGEYQVPDVPKGKVSVLDGCTFPLPRISEPGSVSVRLELVGKEGEALAANTLDLFVLPVEARQPGYPHQISVITRYNRVHTPAGAAPSTVPEMPFAPASDVPVMEAPTPRGRATEGRAGLDLETSISAIGYATTRELHPDTRLVVSNYPNAELLEWVRDGGDLLYLSRGPSPFFWTQPRGAAYSGGWITSFSWIRPEVQQRLRMPNPLSLPYMHVMPTLTILGLPVEDQTVQGDFLAGMVAGWVRHPAVHTVQFRYGKGRVIMTTFALEEALTQDPVAESMFHDLIDHLSSDDCQPILAVD